MDDRSRVISVKLEDDSEIKIEATLLGGEADASSPDMFSFTSITSQIEVMSKQLQEAVISVKPTKASIEFGINVGVESGKITSFLVKGAANANVKITLEWEEKDV